MQPPFISIIHAASLAALCALLLSGCGGAVKDQQTGQLPADTLYPEATLSPEIKQKLYEIPTPLEVTTMLEKAKAAYIFDITNSPENAGRYATEKQKALNLGIYSADLAYSATYNRNDETNKFLGCTMKLADELGITGVYETGIIERVKKTGNNKDSLVALVNKTFIHTNAFLARNNRNYLGLLIATGGFIEGMFLASELSMLAADNTEIIAVIYRQQENFDRLLTVLGAFNTCEDMRVIHDNLAKLKPVFTDFGLGGGKKIDQQTSNKISDLVNGIRREFVRSPGEN